MRSANRALYGSSPGALSVGAQRSLCRGPALSVSGPALLPGTLFVGAQQSSFDALCVGPPAVSCGGLCVGPLSGPNAVCVGASSLCQGPALCRGPALSASGPGALSVGAQCSACGPGDVWALCRVPALAVSGPGTLRVSPALSGALCVGLSGPSALCVGARRSETWRSFLEALCVAGALCPPQQFLCQALALSVSGRSLCVGPRRSLCPGPATLSLLVLGPSLQLRSARSSGL